MYINIQIMFSFHLRKICWHALYKAHKGKFTLMVPLGSDVFNGNALSLVLALAILVRKPRPLGIREGETIPLSVAFSWWNTHGKCLV
jgi:hypothetical protein